MFARTDAAPRQTATVTVTSGSRSMDLRLPALVPLIEILPLIARRLGVLDPTLAAGGYQLVRADGSPLPDDQTLAEQGVADGELLSLLVGALRPEGIIYDDIVEAIGDAVHHGERPWTPQNNADTALLASTGFLSVAIVLLFGIGAAPAVPVIALGAAAICETIAALLARQRQPRAALTLALVGTGFGAASGYQAVRLLVGGESGPDVGPLLDYGLPLVGAGAGLVVLGAVAVAVLLRWRVYALIAVGAGAVLTVSALLSALISPDQPSVVWGMALAVAAIAANGLPWVAMSSARINVQSAHTDQEIFAPPQPIDEADVRRRFEFGAAMLLTARIAVVVVMFVAVPPVAAAPSPLGLALCVLAFVGMMLSTRQSYGKAEVLALMTSSIIGLVLSGLVGAWSHPQWQLAIAIGLGATSVVVIALTLLDDKRTVMMGRVADVVALLSLALLLPLGVGLAGLV